MKKTISIITGCLAAASVFAQDFDRYFDSSALRFDYYRCGNSQNEQIFEDSFHKEAMWGGNRVNLIDTLNRGEHQVRVYDLETNELIFSDGHNSLFQEWRTLPEAKRKLKAFPEAFTMPFPKRPVRIEFLSRDRKGVFHPVFETEAYPSDRFISNEKRPYQPIDIQITGDPAQRVDIVLLSEGYTEGQRELFESDCRKFADELFSFSPYRENRNRFNVRGVWKASVDCGPDIPGDSVWNNTVLNVSFYTFDSERYQMTYDYRKVKEMAGTVPYDFIYILSNTQKYGGGGIFNFYGIGSSANPGLAAKVHVHEFGHLFAGLADEYADNGCTEELYVTDVEPWEPNITTLVDFDRKWKHLIADDTPVPTPIDSAYQSVVGVYEGAGYMTKGIYRPIQKCLMREFGGVEEFCPVCTESIIRQIDRICQ